MPIRDVLIANRAGVVLFRRSYGSLTQQQIDATASILNLVQPLMEQIGKTTTSHFAVGERFLAFKEKDDLMFITYVDSEFGPEPAERMCDDVKSMFMEDYGDKLGPKVSVEELQGFEGVVDALVSHFVGVGSFTELYFNNVHGVLFVAFYDGRYPKWSIRVSNEEREKEIRKLCEKVVKDIAKPTWGMDKQMEMMGTIDAILKFKLDGKPSLLAPIGADGILIVGMDESVADMDLLFEKVEKFREIASPAMQETKKVYVPPSAWPDYQSTLRLYQVLYKRPKECLDNDIRVLTRQGMSVEDTLKKLHEQAKWEI